MARNTWRFNLFDHNLSQDPEITEAGGTIGYMVVRAPKGQTKGYFFPKGSEDMIKRMIGVPNAHWKDLFEAIAFNRKYDLFISAPAGNSKKYPSYYGGVYNSEVGLLPFYHVTNKDNPNFEVALTPGTEKTKVGAANSTIDIVLNKTVISKGENKGYEMDKDEQGAIIISGIDQNVMKKMQYIDFNFWGNSKVPAGIYRYILDKDTGGIYACDENGARTDTFCGYFEKEIKIETTGSGDEAVTTKTVLDTYKIVLGGNEASETYVAKNKKPTYNNSENGKVPFINFNDLINYIDYWSHADAGKLTKGDNDTVTSGEFTDAVEQKIKNLILKGGALEVGGSGNTNPKAYSFAVAPLDIVEIYNVKGMVYSYAVQPSQTSYPTAVTFKAPTYDKYVYDVAIPYASLTDEELQSYEGNNKNPFVNITNGNVFDVYVWDVISEDEETGDEVLGWRKANIDYATKAILLEKQLADGADLDAKTYKHKIIKVDAEGTGAKIMTIDNADEEYKLVENFRFNTFTISSEEVDYTGTVMDGGETTGSLDESSVDEYNGGNYFEDLMPYDTATFIEHHIIKTFDKDLDENGYFKNTRIPEVGLTVTIAGERYVSKVVDENIAAGKLGCDWTPKFGSIFKAGLVEATAPLYEEVHLFMDPSENADMASYYTAICEAHQMASVTAALEISDAQFKNVSTIPLPLAHKNVFFTCGDFQFMDTNTRKKYWSSLIGPYGAMLAKIIDEFYGAIAPAWKNDRGVGGELDVSGILKARWDFTDLDTKIMDKKNINPILITQNGAMVVSQKTSGGTGDWNRIGHVLSFNLFKRELRDTVMTDQLMKPIDEYWIGKQEDKANEILDKRLDGPRSAWTEGKIICSKINTDKTKAKRIFMIQAIVKVKPFSEGVELHFTNIDQTMSIEDF